MASTPDVLATADQTQRSPAPQATPIESKTVQPTAPLPELPKGETLQTLLTPTKSETPDPGYVHLGSLRVDEKVYDNFKKAEEYLGKDPEATKMLSSLVHGDKTTTIQGIDKTDPNGDRFSPKGTFGANPTQAGGTIYWDPHSALITTSGGTQTPALALLHEQGHAMEWKTDPSGYLKGVSEKNQRFTTAEEQRNERGPEEHAAKILGEGTRQDHLGHPYEVSSPTSREPVPVPKVERTPEQLKATIDAYSKFYRTNGYDSPPPAKDASSVKPWDHQAHSGSFMTLDQNTVVQHVGRGQYEVYDVNKDLGGKFPAENTPLSIDAKGQVQEPAHAREQQQTR